jgi:hypothetical protein
MCQKMQKCSRKYGFGVASRRVGLLLQLKGQSDSFAWMHRDVVLGQMHTKALYSSIM